MQLNLSKQKCKPCEGGVSPLNRADVKKMLPKIKGWKLLKGKLSKNFKFKDFKQALKWINKVGALAEKEGHHPDIYRFYNKINLVLYTHAIDGLSWNDFILASKINNLGGFK